MRHNWNFASAVPTRLVHGVLDVQLFNRLNLKVNPAQLLTNHIRRIRRSRELLPPARLETLRPQLIPPLPFSAFAFFS